MGLLQKIPIVILDPYLLIYLATMLKRLVPWQHVEASVVARRSFFGDVTKPMEE